MVSVCKKMFYGHLGRMKHNRQAQNEVVKWKVEIDNDINKDIKKEGLSQI